MKVAIIAPSYNESANIARFLKDVDMGLSNSFNGHETTIFHIDNGSTDGTQEIASKTITKNKKVFIDNTAHAYNGKGANVYVGLENTKDFDVTMMFDTDLKTFSPEWVSIFSKPILEKSVDLVTPLYTRNRYEGNTTNHFSAPLISICFDYAFLQPIAGDFAFSKKMVNAALGSFKHESDYRYGVDTVLTWTAMGNSFKVEQIKAGKKIHNPSFGKIVPMFLQVATSTFLQIHKYKSAILNNFLHGLELLDSQVSFINIDPNFIAKPQEDAIKQLKQSIFQTVHSKEYSELVKNYPILKSKESWPVTLAEIVSHILCQEKLEYATAMAYAKIVSPLFLERVIDYFNSIETLTDEGINSLLSDQLAVIGKNLMERFKK